MAYVNKDLLSDVQREHEARYFRPSGWDDHTGCGIMGDYEKGIRITHKEWNEKIKWYKENGRAIAHFTTKKDWAYDDSYYIDNNLRRLYVPLPVYHEETGFRLPNQKMYYYCMDDDEKNQDQTRKGFQSFMAIYNHFKARTGVSMEEAFQTVPHSFDLFQLPPIVFANSLYCDLHLKNVSKADFSSAYPANICGKLPTYKGSIRRKGRIKPTAEYPFAFYTKSNNMAIYDEFDTFGWEEVDFGSNGSWKGWTVYTKDKNGKRTDNLRPYFIETKEENEETILMKAADFTLDEEMEWLYEQKQNGEAAAKSMMVCSIGYMRSLLQNEHYFAHLTAICYARHINKMIKAYQFLKERGRQIITIATDCFAWIGEGYEGELTTKEKKLGNLVLEYTGVDMYMEGCGRYAIQDPTTGQIYLVKHQGTKEKNIKITKIEDVSKFPSDSVYHIYNKKTNLWEEVLGYDED